MTEAEWLACADPQPMLELLRGKVSERKLRLFACACCRHPDWMLLDRDEAVIAAVEDCVDRWSGAGSFHPVNFGALRAGAVWAAAESAYAGAHEWAVAFRSKRGKKWKPAQAAIVRDIFGNPFRSAIVNSAWLTATVVSLAQGIYDERAFDRLPILADALEDAGCDNADILNHCRQPGEHVRGCWCVDLVRSVD